MREAQVVSRESGKIVETSRLKEQTLRLRVTGVRTQAEGVVSLGLGSEDGAPLPTWEPGAHLEVRLRDDLIRHYSLCGDPSDASIWRIAVLRELNGRGGSEYVHDTIRTGDVLTAIGPRNNFALDESREYLFIAGGIGITPILPMIRAVANLRLPWTLAYGGRSRQSMAFVSELEQIGGGTLHVLPQDEFGLLDLDRFLGAPSDDTSVYCCGPGPLIDAVEMKCIDWPAKALHRERFVAKAPAHDPDGEFEVELSSTGQRLKVPAFVSLLDVLEESGLQIDNSCRAGICGTCVTGVVAGIPEHSDDVLSDDERSCNKMMLPCVSRSKTDLLVLDL